MVRVARDGPRALTTLVYDEAAAYLRAERMQFSSLREGVTLSLHGGGLRKTRGGCTSD